MARRNHKCLLCETMIRRPDYLCIPCGKEVDEAVVNDLKLNAWEAQERKKNETPHVPIESNPDDWPRKFPAFEDSF